MDTLEQTVNEALRTSIGRSAFRNLIQHSAFWAIGMADAAVSLPSWLGAYYSALEEGASEADAIAWGDRVVALGQGSGATMDLSQFQRGGEWVRLYANFMGFFSALYARERAVGRAIKGPADFLWAGWQFLWVIAFPSIIAELLSGRGPDEDPDDPAYLKWAIANMINYSVGGIPIFRDLVSASVRTLQGVPSVEVDASPIADVLTTFLEFGNATVGATVFRGEGVDMEKVLETSVKTAGYAIGLPSGQLLVTGKQMMEVWSGQREFEISDIFFREALE
jgi:hypothetical protein